MDRDIFISYIEEDGGVARALASELRSLGQSTWTYEEDGVAGISYLTQVHRAIESCRAFVLLASERSVKAHQVIREVEQAHEREKIIIAVRLGLSHQQFVAANPILRMASGTAVTLAVDERSIPVTAKRIAGTLSFAEPQRVGAAQGRETPTVETSASSVATAVVASTQARAIGQTGSTNEASVPPPQVLPPGTVATSEPSNSSSFQQLQRPTSKWVWLSVCLGIVGQLTWALPFSALVLVQVLPDAEDGTDVALTWVAFFAAIAALVCGVFLARSFLVIWRSSPLAGAQFHLVKRYLICSIISLITIDISMSVAFGPPEFPPGHFFLLLPLTPIALVWNGLRVLTRAADAASE